MTTKRKTSAGSKRRVELTHHAQVSITSLLIERLKPYSTLLLIFVGFASAIGAVIGGWHSIGLPSLVSDVSLQKQLDATRGEVNAKIDSVKSEISRDMSSMKTQVGRLSIGALEIQQRTLFLQKTQTQSNEASIENQLRSHPDDQFLNQRKMELTNLLQYLDREMAAVQQQLADARSGKTDNK